MKLFKKYTSYIYLAFIGALEEKKKKEKEKDNQYKLKMPMAIAMGLIFNSC